MSNGSAPQTPSGLTFVVQLREGAAADGSAGQVEELSTGQVTRFETSEMLIAFLARLRRQTTVDE